MRTWAMVGAVFIAVVVIAGVVQANKPKAEVSWKCESHSGDTTCVVDNKGRAQAEVDFNLVLVCHDGEHVAHVGAIVEANSHVTKIVQDFEPGLGLMSQCAGIDYRDKIVK